MRLHASPSRGHCKPQQPPPSVGDVMDNADSRPHDSRDCAPVSSDCGPEVSVLPILTRYIDLEQLAECVQVGELVGNE